MQEVIVTNKNDPLGEVDGLSLLKSRFPSLPHDPLAYHLFLESLPVKNNHALVEEGMEILKSFSESASTNPFLETSDVELNPKFESQRHSMPRVDGIPGGSKVYEYKHRYPVKDDSKMRRDNYEETANIGARFGSNRSLEELNSLPVVMGKITGVPVDFDKMKDPHDLFDAFERRKRAQIELARLTGCPLPKLQRKSRPRRHSKVYEYKHWYPSKDSSKKQHEKCEDCNLNDAVQDGICPRIIKQGSEFQSGSVVDSLRKLTEKKNFPGDLREPEVRNLEEEKELNLLLEQVKVKPFEAEQLHILEVPEIRRMLVDDPGAGPNKKSCPLSDIQNMFHNIRRRKRETLDSVSNESPTPPRSPAPVSILRSVIKEGGDFRSTCFVDALGECTKRKALLDELPEGKVKDLEGEKAGDFLQKHLKIKSLMNKKLESLESPATLRTLVFDAGAVPNEESYPFSDTQNDFRRKRKSFGLEISESPTLPRSPFASVSVLGKSISKKSKTNDPFEFSEEEKPFIESPPQSGNVREGNSENICQSFRDLELSSLIQLQSPFHGAISSVQKPLDSTSPYKNLTNDDATENESYILPCVEVAEQCRIKPNESKEADSPALVESSNNSFEFNFTEENSPELSLMKGNVHELGRSPKNTKIDSGKKLSKNKRRKKTFTSSRKRKVKSNALASTDCNEGSQILPGSNLENKLEKILSRVAGEIDSDGKGQIEMEETEETNSSECVGANDSSDLSTINVNAEDEPSAAQCNLGIRIVDNGESVASDCDRVEESQAIPENNHENTIRSGASNLSQTEMGLSQKRQPNNLKKGQSKKAKQMRNSLAGAGTFLQAGERRSSRIRSKPLQFWKGERFLYGRVHQSLITVIGIKKFDSPGNTSLKVKSFVSEEFSDLVKSAALG